MTTAHLRPFYARPMSQGNPAFPGRNVYASSSKLPDRPAQKSGTNNVPSQQYTQSNFGRRPEPAYQFGQSAAPPQQQQQGRHSLEKEPNALSELSEEQRDEINESVWTTMLSKLNDPWADFMRSSLSLTSTAIDIWITTKFASPCDPWGLQFPRRKSHN